jgi:uncharacterized protein YigE (DUF2233 family)
MGRRSLFSFHHGISDPIMERCFWIPTRRRTLRFCSLFLALCVMPGISFAQQIMWERLSEGLAVSVWKPGERCPAVPAMLAADIDPERTRFSVHYYVQEGLSQPPTIEEWQKRTGHYLLFNAGLFRENFTYLGLLYKDGRSLGSRRHTTWQGLFVAEPSKSGLKNARVLDLASDTFDEQQPPYREAAQALMLLDQVGTIRVRQTGKHAHQTIVAEAGNGHILIFKSLDLVTLHDIGQCLKDALPIVRLAMAMDGGSSSDVLVPESLWQGNTPTQDRTSWMALFGGSTVPHIPLPTVIGISAR